MGWNVRRGSAVAVAALLALSPLAPAAAKKGEVDGPLRVEVDRSYVMLGDAVEVEAKYKVELVEVEDDDVDVDVDVDDETPGDDVTEDDTTEDDTTEESGDVDVVVAGRAPEVSTLPTTVAFSVDYGDGTPAEELVVEDESIESLERDPDEFELEAEGTHTYAAPGQYVVTVTATPDVGEVEVRQAWVKVTTEPVPYPRKGKDACPEASIPDSTFADLPEQSVHKRNVDCASAWGLVSGKSADSFDPGKKVTREQLASLLVRMIERAGVTLPEGDDLFADDDGSVHEENIDKLAAAGLVGGTGADTFQPRSPVTRGQMASLLVRVYDHLSDEELAAVLDYFDDDDADVHEDNINLSAAAGFTSGRSLGTYAPSGQVTREQIATFLMRTLDRLVAVDGVTF